MEQMQRYAVYYAPREGAFADRANAWLGADPEPLIPALGDHRAITQAPRRYGFHGTIRAPFRPAEGVGPDQIGATVAQLASRLAPVSCDGLQLEVLEGFIALTPTGHLTALQDLGAAVVKATNDLRAPLSPTDIARRNPDRLSPRQRALLDQWGYPHVMEEFHFHLTLTDRLDAPAPVLAALSAYFAPVLPRPFVIEDLCLFGEDAAGHFHLLHRYALTG